MAAPLVAAAAKVGVAALQTPTGRTMLAAGVVSLLGAPVMLIVVVVAMVGSIFSTATTGGAADAASTCVPAAAPTAVVATWDPVQTGNAAIIVSVAKAADLGPLSGDTERQRAGVLALATSMQESSLLNQPGGDLDSIGLFQQRPSMGWGTPAQLADPLYAAAAFLRGAGTNPGLVAVAGWQTGTLATVVQAVQRSADGTLYAKWEATATTLVGQLWASTPPALDLPVTGGLVPPGTVVAAATTADCGDSDPNAPAESGPGAWGGYQNGQIPATALTAVPWAPAQMLRADATTALIAMNEKYQAEHAGANLALTDTYRSYDDQVKVKAAKGALAAKPGTSNHGWALAIDFGGTATSYTGADYSWLKANGPAFGWTHPAWAEPGGLKLEPWHWEYGTGVAA